MKEYNNNGMVLNVENKRKRERERGRGVGKLI